MRHFEPDYRHAHSDHLTAAAWQPPLCSGVGPSPRLAVIGGDGLIAVHAPLAGELLWQTRSRAGGLEHLSWSPDGQRLAVAGQHQRVEVREAETGEIISRLDAGRPGRNDWVTAMAWSDSGVLAIAAGNRVSVWSSEGQWHADCFAASGTVGTLCWSGGRLLGSHNGGVQAWDPSKGAVTQRYHFQSPLLGLAVSPDLRWIAAAGYEPVCALWPTDHDEPLSMGGFGARVRSLSWAADSSALATASDAEVIVWDCRGAGPAGRKPLVIPFHGERVTALAWHPTRPWLVSADQGGIAMVCALPAGTPLMALVDEEALTAVAWCRAPDSAHLAIMTAAGSVLAGPVCPP